MRLRLCHRAAGVPPGSPMTEVAALGSRRGFGNRLQVQEAFFKIAADQDRENQENDGNHGDWRWRGRSFNDTTNSPDHFGQAGMRFLCFLSWPGLSQTNRALLATSQSDECGLPGPGQAITRGLREQARSGAGRYPLWAARRRDAPAPMGDTGNPLTTR